jgi:hypothetical protein
VLVTEEIARLLDPILRAEIERMRSGADDWALVLDHLAATGPSEVEDLQVELGFRPKDFKGVRSPLERCGAVVSRSFGVSTSRRDQTVTSELARWDQVYPEAVGGEVDLKPLVVAAVRAAVVAPEREVPRWFSWQWYWRPELVDELVAEGRLERPKPGWVTVTSLAGTASRPAEPGSGGA